MRIEVRRLMARTAGSLLVGLMLLALACPGLTHARQTDPEPTPLIQSDAAHPLPSTFCLTGFRIIDHPLLPPLVILFCLMLAGSVLIIRKLITQRRALEELNRRLDDRIAKKKLALKDINDQLRTVLDTMPNPVYFKDENGVYQGCNRAFAQLVLGMSDHEVTGATFNDMKGIVPDDLIESYMARDAELFDRPGVQVYESQVPCPDGTRRDFLFNRAPVIDDQGRVTGVVGVMVDITRHKAADREREQLIEDLRRANDKLERLSITDALTGLSNRGHINRRLDEEIRKADRYGTGFSIIMFDLDHFKLINDSHGHQVGDLVLQTVARVLRENIRDIDLAGRFGGEEFILLLPSTDREGALLIAERIRRSIAAIQWAKLNPITISGGVAEYRGESAAELFKTVDELLYTAKASGRNRIESAP
jgi:diguanylate cyclase (GGDEF)-like protein/PAS domain S-box-containing protein